MTDKILSMKKFLAFFLILLLVGAVLYLIFAKPFFQRGTFNESVQSSALTVAPLVSDYEEKIFIKRDASEQLTLEGVNGEKFELTLPAGSLPESSLVAVRQIEKVNNLPENTKFVAGAALAPDGVSLTGNGLLQITLPDGVETKNLIGFSYHGQGENFYFYPAKIQGRTAVFRLSGFSGYGLLDVGSTDVKIIRSAKQTEAVQKLALILLNKSRSQAAGGPENWTEEELRQITDVLKDWFENSVKLRLEAALADDRLALGAIYEYVSWLGKAQWFGVDGGLETLAEQGKKMSSMAIDNAVKKAGKRCADQKDPSQAGLILKYHGIAVYLGLGGLAADYEQVKNLISKCVNFKLTIKSKLTGQLFNAKRPDIAEVEGEGPITMSGTLALSGNGLIKINRFSSGLGGRQCAPMRPFNFNFEVPETLFKASDSGKKLTLYLDLGDDKNFPVEYPLMASEPVGNNSISDRELAASIAKSRSVNYFDCSFHIGVMFMHLYPQLPWIDDFIEAHSDEGEGLGGYRLKITDWEFVGGDVYARKIYERKKSVPLKTITENTILELRYEPK